MIHSGMVHLREAVLDVFHEQVPRDPKELFAYFYSRRKEIKKLQRRCILKDDQIQLILPSYGETHSSKFDITLIVVLIINFTDLKPPGNGWRREPPIDESSIAAFVLRARQLKNKIAHSTSGTISGKSDTKCDEMRSILIGLRYKNMSGFENLLKRRNDRQFIESIINFR